MSKCIVKKLYLKEIRISNKILKKPKHLKLEEEVTIIRLIMNHEYINNK